MNEKVGARTSAAVAAPNDILSYRVMFDQKVPTPRGRRVLDHVLQCAGLQLDELLRESFLEF